LFAAKLLFSDLRFSAQICGNFLSVRVGPRDLAPRQLKIPLLTPFLCVSKVLTGTRRHLRPRALPRANCNNQFYLHLSAPICGELLLFIRARLRSFAANFGFRLPLISGRAPDASSPNLPGPVKALSCCTYILWILQLTSELQAGKSTLYRDV
jgi:hypothetical protein